MVREVEQIKEVKYSLTKKMSVIFFLMCLFAGIILSTFIIIRNFKNHYERISEKTTNCVKDVSGMLHDAPIDKFLKGENLELYQNYFKGLEHITDSFDLKYLYVYVPDLRNNTLIFIYDIEKNKNGIKENIKLGAIDKDLIPQEDIINFYKKNDGNIFVTIANNKWGHVISAYSVITDKNNSPIALAGVDIDFNVYKKAAITEIIQVGSILFLSLLIMYLFVIFYVNKTFIKPIIILSTKMRNFVSNGKFRYSPVNLNTNDEFNVMADSYNLMAENIQKSMKEIFDSQMETIFSLAKLVQIRDDSTGKHIERVQAYCKILAIAAMKFKLYPEIINYNFIKNLVSASPLHDIGKVGIDDRILLSTNKLTDEEFKIMQNHTIFGEKTLSNINSKFGNNDFIKMGMSIARWHHEKWNGTGYPDGLKGEEIPIEARIAAIADVYDALSTRRVYKPAFSHLKCVQIILEEKGKHFDPQLVDIFEKIQHKFLKIRQSFEEQEIESYFEEDNNV